ncbi:hypothetical protein DVH24_000130 [Malus domestica]|uniref:Uncharacterized protein n=1 Tax=Malus domestica TaxID=3750 RepID=A0A498J4Z3_MALDO|nr:hypothetical protein DVH24_000130 [Malus domestica]
MLFIDSVHEGLLPHYGALLWRTYDIEVEHFDIRLLIKYFPEKFCFVGESNKGRRAKGKIAPKKRRKKILVTCGELERAFKECENKDDALKMGLYTLSRLS